jgi:MFS family permease
MATRTRRRVLEILDVDGEVLTLALARMVDSFGNSFLIVVLPLYITSASVSGTALGVSETLVVGIILSAFGFFNSGLQPFTGRASDRFGSRKTFVLVGLGILAVANFTYSYVNSYLLLLLVRALQGIGAAFTVPATVALVNELSGANTRGGNMGTFNTFRILGFAAGPLVAGSIVEAAPYTFGIAGATVQLSGFDAAFYIAALGAAVSFMLVTALIDDPDRTHADAGDDLDVTIFARDDDHLLDPVFTLGLASLFMAVGIALLSAIEPRVNMVLNQGPVLFGIEFAAFSVAQVLFQSPIGSASDSYGRRPFIVWGLVLLVPATLAQGLVVAPWQMVVARFAQGLAGAMVFAPALALAGDLATGGESGTQLSILTMSFGLGVAIGPLASGYLIRYGFVAPFAFGAVLAAVGAVLVYTQVEETVDVGPTFEQDHHICRSTLCREG